jgi:hypothetical protein
MNDGHLVRRNSSRIRRSWTRFEQGDSNTKNRPKHEKMTTFEEDTNKTVFELLMSFIPANSC